MLDGVEVDELTTHFLDVATDRERSAELSSTLRRFFHDARDHLNSLKMGLYLVRRRAEAGPGPIWDELDLSYRGLEQLVDRLQTICRPLELAPVEGDLGRWLEERRACWSSRLGAVGRRLEWVPPMAPAVGRFDPMHLIQGLDALVAWRTGEGGGGDPVRLAWGCDGGYLHVEWSEAGPAPDGPIEGRDGRSVSMTLPLLAHILTAHGGSISVSRPEGLAVHLVWPTEGAVGGPA